MTRTHETPATPVTAPPAPVRPVQAAAVLTLLVLLWQFLSAGRILTGEDATGGHGAGAIALHVATGLLLLSTVLHARSARVWWPAGVAAAVLVLGFVQAALGSSGSMALHVPAAMVLTVGAVWLAAWASRSAS